VVNGLDTERRETLGWSSWYRTVARQCRVGEGCNQIKLVVELLDRPEAEIGGEEEVAGVGCRERQSFVHRTRELPLRHGGAIYPEDGVRRVKVGVKARDGPIFRRKEELGGEGLAVLTDDEVNRPVEHIARWCCGFYASRSGDSNRRCDLFA